MLKHDNWRRSIETGWKISTSNRILVYLKIIAIDEIHAITILETLNNCNTSNDTNKWPAAMGPIQKV